MLNVSYMSTSEQHHRGEHLLMLIVLYIVRDVHGYIPVCCFNIRPQCEQLLSFPRDDMLLLKLALKQAILQLCQEVFSGNKRSESSLVQHR